MSLYLLKNGKSYKINIVTKYLKSQICFNILNIFIEYIFVSLK